MPHRWPGNVRELENAHAPRGACSRSGDEIGVDAIRAPDGAPARPGATAPTSPRMRPWPQSRSARNLVGRTVAEVEQDLILETLTHCLGNRTHAANILGISIRTLRNKLNEYAAGGSPIPPPHGGELKGAA